MARYLYIFLFLILGIGQPNAQTGWVGKMEHPEKNFYEIQKAFNNFWADSTGPGWKQFKRWENFMSPRVYPTGERFDPGARWEAYQEYKKDHPTRTTNGDWEYIGNDDVPMYGGAGRVNCIEFHPKDDNTIFIGAASGGLWKSRSNGSYWENLTDDLPVLGVSDIAIHPQNPDTMYLATGDGDGSDTYSVGVLRSTDGGKTWSAQGWSVSVTSGMVINRLIMDPSNPQVLLAATNEGIYKTTTSGSSWFLVKSGRYRDLEFHPNNPSVVYASRYGAWSNDTEFLRSTDKGNTWTTITAGTPNPGDVNRIEIAVSPATPNRVYFIAGDASSSGFYGFYRSDDSGQNFYLTASSPNILGYSPDGTSSGGQSWYDLAIAAHPNKAGVVFTGGINVWKTTDGGYNFDVQTHWWGAQGISDVHADQHALVFKDNGTLFAGNDGGIFMTQDEGNQWYDLSDGLHIGQIYRLGQSRTNPSLILSGWQDNGTNRKAFSSWQRVIGGDGMECIIDHSDPSIMYGTIYFGRIYRSTDGGSSFSVIVSSDSSNGVHESGGWVTPYIMNPQNSSEILVGKTQVYRTFDGGNNWGQVGSISGGSGKIEALAMCPTDNNYIYVAKDDKLWVSEDGITFNDRTNGLPVSSNAITYIAVHHSNPERAWVTFSGYDANNKVYYTDDAGMSWTNISQGLPNVPANCVVYEKNADEGIYVGTDLGVYYMDSTMSTFQNYNYGLPNVIVNELAIHYGSGMLRAATYGRGLWESDLHSDEPSSIKEAGENYSLKLYPNPTKGSIHGRINGKTIDGKVGYVLRDPMGRVIERSTVPVGNNFQLDLAGKRAGLYFLTLDLPDGKITKKISVH